MNVPIQLKEAIRTQQQEQATALQKAEEVVGLVGLKTKFAEDVYFGAHRSVWGSYFDTDVKKWGYACCFSLDRTAEKCLGQAGKQAFINSKEAAKDEAARLKREEEERLKKEQEPSS